jgi:aromatase
MTIAEDAKERAEHRIDIAAPPSVVYGLVADVTQWPVIFSPTVHVEVLERSSSTERLRLWALANGEVRTWISRRWLNPEAQRIEFRQEICSPPVAAMGGTWTIHPAADGGSHIVLGHDYSAVGGDPAAISWIAAAVDRNSQAELAALLEAAELGQQLDELSTDFEDSVEIAGDAQTVFEFLYQAQLWPERLPHVSALELEQDGPDVQRMTMSTRAPDGSVHTTESVRARVGDRIVYKQTVTPALLAAHTGTWTVRAGTNSVIATSAHRVLLRAEAIPEVLGADATISAARDAVRKALGANSMTTLQHAKSFAEQRHA